MIDGGLYFVQTNYSVCPVMSADDVKRKNTMCDGLCNNGVLVMIPGTRLFAH